MKKLSVKNFPVRVGGQQHTGWLPEKAETPLPTPVRELLFDFAIEELEKDGGFLLIYQSKDGQLYGDTWHKALAEAMRMANEEFRIPEDLWKELN